MVGNVGKLLLHHLRSSAGAWLCAALALQLVVTSAAWALGAPHELLPGVFLLAVAGTQTAPARGLPWQILPISRRDIALAHWCTVALLPAIALSASLLLAGLNNRSTAWPMPPTSSIVLQVAGVWSAFGYLAWLPLRTGFVADRRRTLASLSAWGVPFLLATYGYPLQYPARLLSIVIISVGNTLLLLSLLRAHLGQVPTADASPGGRLPNHEAAPHSRTSAPLRRVLLSSVLSQTAWMSCLGLSGIVLLRNAYPHAPEAVLWTFLGSVSLGSVIVAQRWTRSLWMWRCLPLTTGRTTFLLQAVQLSPLMLTVSAAWLFGRLAPSIILPMPAWLPAATIAVVSMANAQAPMTARRNHEPYRLRYWLAPSATVAYMSILLGIQPVASLISWFPPLAWVLAAVLLALSNRMTSRELLMPEAARRLEVRGAH